MIKLHLCYYELSPDTQKELKRMIADNYEISAESRKKLVRDNKRYRDEMIKAEVNELFNLNNAGIDLDIYNWMK